MNQILPTILLAVILLSIDTAPATAQSVVVSHSQLEGIGEEPGVMRRDPSDVIKVGDLYYVCLLYTSPSPRDRQKSRMPSSA